MDNARQQIVDSIKNNSNILVTVSTDPSVDELSAALGLTILLNNMDKRATSVFSGVIPAAISFLEPDKTFENSADSLRDFIIALDKEKADHLRYKVEGDVVKIFITPYKTTLSQDDLEFSEGDYNVELIIALGVKDQDHLDKALEAHGKILHDAAVVTVTAGADASNLGSVDWHDASASSLSEMIVSLTDGLKGSQPLLDEQISTALLTGIVSATDRFSNDLTSSQVMTMAAQLMAAGANQQLIAAKLEEAHDIAPGSVAGTPLASNTGDDNKPQTGNELTIERPGRAPSPKPENETVKPVEEKPVDETPAPAQEAVKEESKEELDQQELDKQLAGLATPPTGTLADIENELQQAADQAAGLEQTLPLPAPVEAVDVPAPLTAASDATMPGFEPTEMVLPPPPPLPPLPPIETVPAIDNDHGTLSTSAPEPIQSINSIQNNPNEGEITVDPFNTPLAPPEAAPSMPAMDVGTPEGAAILAAGPESTLQAPQVAPTIPELPPLPPLPSTDSLPPLPPPPPPPNFGAQPGAQMSGAVSGDVFGDAATATPPPASVPPEPGQFKIPGQ